MLSLESVLHLAHIHETEIGGLPCWAKKARGPSRRHGLHLHMYPSLDAHEDTGEVLLTAYEMRRTPMPQREWVPS